MRQNELIKNFPPPTPSNGPAPPHIDAAATREARQSRTAPQTLPVLVLFWGCKLSLSEIRGTDGWNFNSELDRPLKPLLIAGSLRPERLQCATHVKAVDEGLLPADWRNSDVTCQGCASETRGPSTRVGHCDAAHSRGPLCSLGRGASGCADVRRDTLLPRLTNSCCCCCCSPNLRYEK